MAFYFAPEADMDPVKAEGKKKNLSARLERRKKWWSEKKNNTRLTRGINPEKILLQTVARWSKYTNVI